MPWWSVGHLRLPLENWIQQWCSSYGNFKLNFQGWRPGHFWGGVLEFTALLTQGRWPSGVKNLLPQMHLPSGGNSISLSGRHFSKWWGGCEVIALGGGGYELNHKQRWVPFFWQGGTSVAQVFPNWWYVERARSFLEIVAIPALDDCFIHILVQFFGTHLPVLLGCPEECLYSPSTFSCSSLSKDKESLMFVVVSWVALSVLQPDLWEVCSVIRTPGTVTWM